MAAYSIDGELVAANQNICIEKLLTSRNNALVRVEAY